MDFAPRTILVLNHRHVGDVLCSFPALAALRHRWPQARVVNVAPPLPLSVLEGSGLSERLLATRKNWHTNLKVWRAIRMERPALAVCFANTRRMRVLARLSGAPRRVGYAQGKGQKLLTETFEPLIKKGPPWLDDDLHLVESFGCAAVQRHIVGLLSLSQTERAVAERFWQQSGLDSKERVVAFNLGASDIRRHWGVERFGQVANALSEYSNTHLLILGGSADVPDAERFQSLLKRPALQATGGFSIRQTAALLERCALLVTGDSGPMHLSIAVNTPVVALFGPVAAAHRLPVGFGHIGLQRNTICRQLRTFGCHNQDTCQMCQCLLSISPDEVIAAASTLL